MRVVQELLNAPYHARWNV